VLLLFSWDTQNIIPANIPDPTKALATTK
jgi:hypothetical protein